MVGTDKRCGLMVNIGCWMWFHACETDSGRVRQVGSRKEVCRDIELKRTDSCREGKRSGARSDTFYERMVWEGDCWVGCQVENLLCNDMALINSLYFSVRRQGKLSSSVNSSSAISEELIEHRFKVNVA